MAVAIGDSKSARGEWQGTLQEVASGDVETRAYGGYTVAQGATAIDGWMSSLDSEYSGPDPAFLVNFGANDVVALPAEATWKSNYSTIIETINSYFPSSTIYLAKPWRRSEDTDCDTIAGWIDDLVATYGYVSVGHDERAWLENGDNGVTMTDDGIHYSEAGALECAAQWATVLGF